MSQLLQQLHRSFNVARFILLQTVQRNIISIKRSWLFSPATQPDTWSAVAKRPYLYPSRIFKPRIDDAGTLPLIIMVHGGGFIMNNPSVDDPLARFLADSCNCNVISIDYRKAPIHQFPAAYEDIVSSILTIIDEDGSHLSIDRDRVILFGSSAGGNLVLGAAQDVRLRQKILGIVALYPVVNCVPTGEEQMATRPDPSVPDMIGPFWNTFVDLYAGTSDVATLSDPRLSPALFNQREDLPSHVFLVGCEHDMFCHETQIMAQKLNEAVASENGRVNEVRWTLVKGRLHAFDHFSAKDKGDEEERLRDKESMYQDVARWLRKVFDKV